jgi:hypothetical protein
MKAIVMVCMPVRDQQLVRTDINGVSDPPARSETAKATPPQPFPDPTNPPFWTWFIENPPRCGT